MWGSYEARRETAKWVVIGGPVIGFTYRGYYDKKQKPNNAKTGFEMSLILGDVCRPKYFGAHQYLSVELGEERFVNFYWQKSAAEYYFVCLTKGLFSV